MSHELDLSLYSTGAKYSAVITDYNAIADVYMRRHSAQEEFPGIFNDFMESLRPNSLLLDCGSGPGTDSRRFAYNGHTVIALDVAENMLQLVDRQDVPIQTIRSSMLNIPVPENTFDAIWSCRSLLHITEKDVPVVLSEFKRVLRPGGMLGLTTLIADKNFQGLAQEELLPESLTNEPGVFYYRNRYDPLYLLYLLQQQNFINQAEEVVTSKDNEQSIYFRTTIEK